MRPGTTDPEFPLRNLLRGFCALLAAAVLTAPLGCAFFFPEDQAPARAARPQPEPTPFKAITSAERRAQWNLKKGAETDAPAPAASSEAAAVEDMNGGPGAQAEGERVVAAAPEEAVPALAPLTVAGSAAIGRADAVRLYREVYLPALRTQVEWQGDIERCDAGSEGRGSLEATRRMVNYFRTMAGLPGNIVFDPVLSSKCRQAALSFVATPGLSHAIPRGWACYSPEANEAAGASNIALGYAGPRAVAAYMEEPWEQGWSLTHRQWILWGPTQRMGSGSVHGRPGGYRGANALWVQPARLGPKSPSLKWVAWPPKGHVPYPVVYRHWSLAPHVAGSVDLRGATVTMRRGNGETIALRRGFSNSPYAPDAAVAWVPEGLDFGPGMADETFEIRVGGIRVSGQPVSYRYSVTVIDPEA